MDTDKILFDERKLRYLWNDIIKPELFREIINAARIGECDIEFSTSIIENKEEIDYAYPWHEDAISMMKNQIYEELQQNKYQDVCVVGDEREFMISCRWHSTDDH